MRETNTQTIKISNLPDEKFNRDIGKKSLPQGHFSMKIDKDLSRQMDRTNTAQFLENSA